MTDNDLTQVERQLAQLAIAVGEDLSPRTGYPEDHTTPDTEDDVLSSTLYTRQGDPQPKAGFTLHSGDRAYRVIIEPLVPGSWPGRENRLEAS